MTLMVRSVSGTEPKLTHSSKAIRARLSGTTILSRRSRPAGCRTRPTHSDARARRQGTCWATLRCAS
jgi:hypothetical protein